MILFLSLWLHCTTCGILIPQPRIELVPPALEVWSLLTLDCQESPKIIFLNNWMC